MIVEIMVEVLNILALATKEVKRERLKRYFRKLAGNTDLEDSLQKLDRLTQDEARMASAEQLKMAQNIDDRVTSVQGEVQGTRSDVQIVRGDVQDVGHGVHAVDNRVQGIVREVRDISSRVQGVDDKLHRDIRNQLRDNIFRWLSPPDQSTNHIIARKARHNGTAQWFFQGSVFKEWNSTGSFLWIHGKPGSGKSVLCSSIIQDIMALRDAGRASIAYFYFDFRDVDKQKLCNLLPSLLIQLSTRSDHCFDILSRLYSSCDRGVQKPDDRAMIECLKEMLTLEAQRPTYIIMDAIDECPMTFSIPSPRDEVLEFVKELVGFRLPNLHICVTSRLEHDIQAAFKSLTLHDVSLHDEEGQKQDIFTYVESFVRSDQRMRRWREDDRDLVINTLSEGADGMFRWVFCQLEILRYSLPPSVRRILKELPESLDETYERILRDIRKPNQEHAHRLLQSLVAAVRPLRVKELAEVLAVDFTTEGIPRLNLDWRWEDQEEAVMSACSSLVIIVKEGDSSIVQFSHFSVKEFLMAKRLAESIKDVSHYYIQLETAHTILAQACLGVLLGLDNSVDRDNIEDFPLARYAAQYWNTHARVESVSSRIEDGMKCLFNKDRPHFATWLWIYNEDSQGRSISTKHPRAPDASPLYYAAMLGFHDLAKHLIAKRPRDVNDRGGGKVTPLHVAVSAGHLNILSLLLDHGAHVDGQDRLGQTPLHRASSNGRVEAGQCLLDRGADINARDNDRWTPLFHAAFQGHSEFTGMLIERGAEIDARDTLGTTPLHRVVQTDNFRVVQLLLERGADVNARSGAGKIPSELAWLPKIVELLSEYGTKSEDS